MSWEVDLNRRISKRESFRFCLCLVLWSNRIIWQLAEMTYFFRADNTGTVRPLSIGLGISSRSWYINWFKIKFIWDRVEAKRRYSTELRKAEREEVHFQTFVLMRILTESQSAFAVLLNDLRVRMLILTLTNMSPLFLSGWNKKCINC